MTDLDDLIAEAEGYIERHGVSTATLLIERLIDALAAQPVLDPEKVAEVIFEETRYRNLTPQARKSLTRAICEAAKRGELG